MDMIIRSEPESHQVDDYDFTFVGGILMPVTVDPDAGDTIEVTPSFTKIHLAEKVSPGNPESKLPSEDITIYNSQLLSVQHRTRKLVMLSEKQRAEWQKVIKTMVQ